MARRGPYTVWLVDLLTPTSVTASADVESSRVYASVLFLIFLSSETFPESERNCEKIRKHYQCSAASLLIHIHSLTFPEMTTKQQSRYLAAVISTVMLFTLAKTYTNPLEGNYPDSHLILGGLNRVLRSFDVTCFFVSLGSWRSPQVFKQSTAAERMEIRGRRRSMRRTLDWSLLLWIVYSSSVISLPHSIIIIVSNKNNLIHMISQAATRAKSFGESWKQPSPSPQFEEHVKQSFPLLDC